ncbi:PhzF family phenazine biosynthesis protein [Ghiorsea bivora]|uniref:PhzF family phenazine biosynthesis protein n=1 Tax=Ghiorsea bivora TaxID=1485545 RepID=UPI00056EC745|nr:PhzF family phenazine biosynthesis protein [Ghiorsea bivora]
MLKIYQIDAFASDLFTGNPAAVCPLDTWLDEKLMQHIAAENNLSETAFFVENNGCYDIRWFTPTVEVALCGHATLAAAYVLFRELGFTGDSILFQSKSSALKVRQDGDRFILDFPKQMPEPCVTPAAIQHVFGDHMQSCFKHEDYIVVLSDEAAVIHAAPNMQILQQLDLRGVCITARSKQYDFVSRFFAPNCGIDEDPVTGSSFTQLAPYWAKALAKNKLTAKQVSQRGGEVWCELVDDRVYIAGEAVKYAEGFIAVEPLIG